MKYATMFYLNDFLTEVITAEASPQLEYHISDYYMLNFFGIGL
jgi:hypothetical protein